MSGLLAESDMIDFHSNGDPGRVASVWTIGFGG